MKKFGLTILIAVLGSGLAFGARGVTRNSYADTTVVENHREVNFESKPLISSALSSAGETDFEVAAAAVTPAVVYIRVTYSTKDVGDQGQSGDMFGQRMRPRGPQMASGLSFLRTDIL